MGRRFGKEWDLAVSTPSEALQLIEANEPGVMAWIKSNKTRYANYRVTITDMAGKKVCLDNSTFCLNRAQPAVIRFTPITRGASAIARIVVGVVLIVYGAFTANPAAMWAGASMLLGGLIEILSPTPKIDSKAGSSDDGTSYYFNGPVNTSAQGIPVPLIYGRCLVGSQAVSAHITIEQLMG